MANMTKEELKEVILSSVKDYRILVNDINVMIFYDKEMGDYVVKFTEYHPEYFETYTFCLTSGKLVVTGKFHNIDKESKFTGEYVDCFYIHRNHGETLQLFFVGTDGGKITLDFAFYRRKTIQSIVLKYGIKH